MKRTDGSEDLSRMPAEPGFLSRGEVARLFGVSLSTVTRWARTGMLPAARTPGGHYRYPAEEMRRMARSGSAAILNVDRGGGSHARHH